MQVHRRLTTGHANWSRQLVTPTGHANHTHTRLVPHSVCGRRRGRAAGEEAVFANDVMCLNSAHLQGVRE